MADDALCARRETQRDKEEVSEICELRHQVFELTSLIQELVVRRVNRYLIMSNMSMHAPSTTSGISLEEMVLKIANNSFEFTGKSSLGTRVLELPAEQSLFRSGG